METKTKRESILAFAPAATFIIIMGLMFVGAYMMAPGSYSRNQRYDFRYTDGKTLLEKVKKLKEREPNLTVLTKDQYGKIYNPDGGRDEAYQWFGFYFNLPINDTTVIVSILLNDKAEESSEMLLVGYTYNMNIWNDTKDKEEEKQVKKIFEKEVLDKLGVKYSKRWF